MKNILQIHKKYINNNYQDIYVIIKKIIGY